MAQNQHNIHIEVSPSHPSQNQQQQQQSSDSSSDGKMMTQAEYLKYKQADSQANNYYGFSREVDMKPVAWVCAHINITLGLFLSPFFLLLFCVCFLSALKDGKFAPAGPENVFIVPNRNASNVGNFYGFCREPDVRPVVW
jgi:hypothetical protein